MKQDSMRKLISFGLLMVLVVLFSLSGEYFLSASNVVAIFRDAAIVGIMGVGLTYVILTGGIDLSSGSIMGLVGMAMANIYQYTTLPIWIMLVVGAIVGMLAGLFNGFIITKLQLPEFIATLSTLSIYRAVAYIIAIRKNGLITSQAMKARDFAILGSGIGQLYFVILVFIAMVIIGQVVLKRTRFGTNLYAVGANKKAAQLSGIPLDRTRMTAYIIMGLCVAIATIFQTARMQSTTVLLGQGMEFNVIAAVVVGGCALSGGRGDVIGTFIGALFMATLNNGIYKFQINTSYQLIIKGLIIVGVVVFDSWYNDRVAKKAQKRQAEGATT